MRAELEKALANQFEFMRIETTNKTNQIDNLYQAFGIETDDGWYQMIYNLCDEISNCISHSKESVKLVVTQIKEKYGTLRFYYCVDGCDAETKKQLNAIVDKYESMSENICECCGSAGKLRDVGGWLMVRCDACYDSMKRE